LFDDFVFVIAGFAEFDGDDEDSVEYDKNDGDNDSLEEANEDDVSFITMKSCDTI
jgi:hypothetical protein